MERIELKKMSIRNFRKIKELDVAFNSNGSVITISGRNGEGKTALYDAYCWALFGKTTHSNGIVQVLDENNEIEHKIETSVELIFHAHRTEDSVNEFSVRRVLEEEWKYIGTPDEKFCGTKVTRFYNEVPMTERDFNRHLDDICPLDKWQIFSNINAFMAMKVEDRRKLLFSIAKDIEIPENFYDECEDIADQVYNGASIEELQKMYKASYKKANDELQQIPSKIGAKKALYVKEDFASLENQLAETRQKLTMLTPSAEGGKELREVENRLSALRIKKSEAIQKALDEKNNAIAKAREEVVKLEEAISSYGRDITTVNAEIGDCNKLLATHNEKYDAAKANWRETNSRVFAYDSVDVCPVCGKPFTDADKDNEKAKAVRAFNEKKTKELSAYYNECVDLSVKIKTGNERLRMLQSVLADKQVALSHANNTLVGAKKTFDEIFAINVEENADIQSLSFDIKETESKYARLTALQGTGGEEKSDAIKLLRQQEETLISRLSARENNARIDTQIKELEEMSVSLAQTVADCEMRLYHIALYKKKNAQLIEDNINQYFSMVTWKFFELNLTNDNEKEICTCLYKGVDYDNLNKAAQINAGIDIVQGLAKGSGYLCPTWVDNTESVAKVLTHDEQQTFVLRYAECDLTII